MSYSFCLRGGFILFSFFVILNACVNLRIPFPPSPGLPVPSTCFAPFTFYLLTMLRSRFLGMLLPAQVHKKNTCVPSCLPLPPPSSRLAFSNRSASALCSVWTSIPPGLFPRGQSAPGVGRGCGNLNSVLTSLSAPSSWVTPRPGDSPEVHTSENVLLCLKPKTQQRVPGILLWLWGDWGRPSGRGDAWLGSWIMRRNLKTRGNLNLKTLGLHDLDISKGQKFRKTNKKGRAKNMKPGCEEGVLSQFCLPGSHWRALSRERSDLIYNIKTFLSPKTLRHWWN